MTKFLLDTHVLLWLASNQRDKFSSEIISLLENRKDHQYYVSAVSIWEIEIKTSLNKPEFQF